MTAVEKVSKIEEMFTAYDNEEDFETDSQFIDALREVIETPDNIISGSTLTDVGRYKARNNGE